ncbi:MAG: ABC transporter permease subunit [Thermoplasmata archaeon]|nr:ABC transporter permease subunit [Thermoplasmata archaeon]
MRRPEPGLAGLVPLLLFVGGFALLPPVLLFLMAWSAEGGATGLSQLLGDPLNQAAIANSLVQGGLSAAAAVAVGYPAGVFLGRYQFKGRDAVLALFSVPFLLPTLVVVAGVEDLFGPLGIVRAVAPSLGFLGDGLGGILLVNVCFNLPLVALLTAVGVESADSRREEAVAVLGGGPGRSYLEVWGPPSWVGAGAGALLTFLFSAMAFAAPLLVCGPRCYTLEARIFTLDQQLVQPGAAGLLALSAVMLLALPTLSYLWLVTRLRERRSASEPALRPVPWGRPVGLALAAATGAVVVLIGSLAAAVGFRALHPAAGGQGGLFSPEVTQRLGISSVGALGNTLFFAAGAAVVAVLLGILAGFLMRTYPPLARPVQLPLFLPLLVSPVILSFSVAEFWRPLLGGESDVWFLILLSQATLALPFATQSLWVGLRRVPASYGEGARTLGARPMTAYLDAELPLVRGALLAAAVFAFALGLGEFTATYFLATPRFSTWTVELYHLQSLREYAAADQLAFALLLLSFVSFLGLLVGGRRVRF